MTVARTITDKNGQRSQPNKKHDTRNRVRKNHKIMSRGVELLKLPPKVPGIPGGLTLAEIKKSHGTINR